MCSELQLYIIFLLLLCMMMDSHIFFQYYLCILLEGLGGGVVGGSCNIIKENIHNNIMKELFLEIIWLK